MSVFVSRLFTCAALAASHSTPRAQDRLRHAFWLPALLTLLLAACGGGGGGGSSQTVSSGLAGSAQKGPFLSGAVLTVRPLQSDGSIGSESLQASLDANGAFSTESIQWTGASLLTVSGQSFNENDGSYVASLSLDAVIELQDGGTLDANVNLYTHLLAARVRRLMNRGTAYASARSTGLDELVTLLGLSLGSSPEDLDLTAGGSTDNANLLLFSASLLAVTDSQADIDTLADDFADNGLIDGSALVLFDSIADAADSVDLAVVAGNLQSVFGVTDPPGEADLAGTTPTWTNSSPVAEAGSDRTLAEGTAVSLDGSDSSDRDGSLSVYTWAQIGGTGVVLDGSNSALAGFTAPSVTTTTVLTFKLTVTDNEGASDSDTVSISVTPVNAEPTADAGTDRNADEGSEVTLDGSASSDSDGSIAAYAWQQTGGSAVVLGGSSSAQASFIAPTLTTAESLTFELTVTDNEGASAVDSVTIDIQPVNAAPVADAGSDRSVDEGSLVTLDGSASGDSDGNIAAASWQQTGGTAVTLDDSSALLPRFTAPPLTVATQLTFELTVTDNEGASAVDSVTISVQPVNIAPVADAGGPYSGTTDAAITVSAAASSDSDGSIASYAWDLDNDGQYDDATGASVDFSTAIAGSYSVGVRVTDNEGASDSASATISVSESVSAGGTPYEGYNLYQTLNSTTAYLMDNDGNTVHSWATAYRPGLAMYLLPDGDLLRTGNLESEVFTSGGAGGIVLRIDWDGNVTWEYRYASDTHLQHHDIEILPNGNILMIAWQLKTQAEAIAAGRDPGTLGQGELWVDSIVEIEPTGSDGGNIVWQWHVWDHLVQDYDATKPNHGTVADHPELIDLNHTLNSNADWNHINAIDYNPALDQILVSVHNFSEIWIIDHSTTTAEAAGHSGGTQGRGGDLLYRWGNPQAYGAGTASDQKLFVQHDAEWIEDGLPGAGEILIFNNGNGRPEGDYSSIEQIVPPLQGDGSYLLAAGQAYGPQSSTWNYTAATPTDFYAQSISGQQRLPNGNTLICEGPSGSLFEVTDSGETVWQYSAGGAVFRVDRYAADYAGFDGTALDDNPANAAPSADAGGPYSGTTGTLIALDGSASSDSDGSLVSFAWDLDNDGQFDDASGFSAQFPATAAGSYTISLQVTDDQGLSATDSTSVTVSDGTTTALAFAVADTAQTACYDSNGVQTACTGQGYDADYTGNTPSYTLSDDRTRVTDNVTGLVWTQTPDLDGNGSVDADDKLSQPDAVSYCAALNLGGLTWRLPSIKEQYSLIVFTGSDPSGYSGTDTSTLSPFIDSAFEPGFGDSAAGERIIDGQYATSTLYTSPAGTINGADTMFGVNFIDGRIKGYPYNFPVADPKTFYVLCVSSDSEYGINDFHDNGDGTVSDNATGLMWQQDDSSGLTFEQAVSHCEAATTAGHDDWRLPNVKELQGIVDYTRAPDTTNSAAIDPVFNATSFTNEGGETDWGYYWSSTTHANYLGFGSAGSYVAFGRALGYFNGAVVDVHGAGAQRSSHKTDASLDQVNSSANVGYGLFYYGGPQGDIARTDNMVRCVRGG